MIIMKFVQYMACIVPLSLGFAASTSCQAFEVLHVDGSYTQAATGMVFPAAVGDFKRINIIRYKNDGTDESAGYNRPTPGKEISATVYVFFSPSLISVGSPQSVVDDARQHLCSQQFQAVEHEIISAHYDAVFQDEAQSILSQNGSAHAGFRVSYKLMNPVFFDRTNVVSRSDAYLFCFVGSKWSIEYRIDYPADYDASTDIRAFMEGLKWTIADAD